VTKQSPLLTAIAPWGLLRFARNDRSRGGLGLIFNLHLNGYLEFSREIWMDVTYKGVKVGRKRVDVLIDESERSNTLAKVMNSLGNGATPSRRGHLWPEICCQTFARVPPTCKLFSQMQKGGPLVPYILSLLLPIPRPRKPGTVPLRNPGRCTRPGIPAAG
jgi:hypothetical protein